MTKNQKRWNLLLSLSGLTEKGIRIGTGNPGDGRKYWISNTKGEWLSKHLNYKEFEEAFEGLIAGANFKSTGGKLEETLVGIKKGSYVSSRFLADKDENPISKEFQLEKFWDWLECFKIGAST